jgi:hypothetical protein
LNEPDTIPAPQPIPTLVAALTTDQAAEIITEVNREMRTIRYLTRASPLMLSRASIEDRNVKLAACLDRIWALMPDKEEKT